MSNDPFKLLQDMERRCLAGAAGLSANKKSDDGWVGVGFRVGDDRLIAAMGQVKEILELPVYTAVPGVKSWVIGVANVRGNLMPLMDLKCFLTGENTKNRRKGRVIVIDYKGFNTGLIVEEVFGMKHFLTKEDDVDVPDINIGVKPYVDKAYTLENDCWPLFNFNQMASDDNFANASL